MRDLGPFLRDAWKLAKPYFNSEERWSARVLLLSIIALNLLMVGMDVVLNFWNNAFYTSLQEKDWGTFVSLLFFYKHTSSGFMPGFCGVAAAYILVAVYRTYLNQWLQIRWRRWMTERFMDEWLADRAYYRISLASQAGAALGAKNGLGTDNPDQRISEDLRSFVASTLGLGLELLSNVVSLFSFITILWTLSGPVTLLGLTIPGYMVWVSLVYAALGTVVTHLVGRPLAALNFRQQRVEADFRFSLMRLRENVEGVALYSGEREEHRGLGLRFRALMANWWLIMQRTKMLNALVAGYGQVAVVFPIIVAAPRYFSGAITLGGLTQTAGAFNRVQDSMSWFVNSYAALAEWRATVERLALFHQAIVEARAAATEGVTFEPPTGEGYALHNATLALPSGERLLDRANLKLTPGRSVVVTGRSGSGKSTLFRALAGIWPFGSGHVQRPSGKVLFLPQRPYIPLGTLRHAATYPADADTYDDSLVRDAMVDVGLETFIPRLDENDNWAQRLSGGEQQRLALARALLAQPDWLFLDEATASLDPEAEAELYALLRERLPNTTIVSIAHRPTVAALHSQRLVFERATEGPGRLVEAVPAE
jgi:putative ATP-binding cassette transporter